MIRFLSSLNLCKKLTNFAIITFIASLIMIDESDGNSLFGIPISIDSVGEGIILCNNFKWKAYMLQNTYETNETNSKKK